MTWLSHMLDVELFDLDAGRHHQVNLMFHAANTVLLFLVLRGMTGALWQSGFAAALFAVHPLHVESVAWVAERKDVLSTFFFLMTLGAYMGVATRKGPGRYALTVVLFALGLLSKPMLVTLPFVLLLLDYWPLGRVAGSTVGGGGWAELPRLAWEKTPLFVLSLASCVVAYMAQAKGGAVSPAELVPFGVRVANAAVSYAGYLVKTVWPGSLSVFYPHPLSLAGIPAWKVAGSALLLMGLSLLSVWQARRRPYLLAGWLWYVGTLVPAIGLVQVGGQAMADRYTYVPLIGVFVMIAWGVPDTIRGWRWRRHAMAVAGGLSLLALSVAARSQVSYWRSSVALYEHAVEVAPDDYMSRYRLGRALVREGKVEEAIFHYRQVLASGPWLP